MSLPDQIVFGSPVSKTYERLGEGLWIESSTSLDNPDYLSVQNRNLLNNNGTKPAQITVKKDLTKNNPVAGLPDVKAQYWGTFQYPPGAFTQAELEALKATVDAAIAAYMTRLLRAEK